MKFSFCVPHYNNSVLLKRLVLNINELMSKRNESFEVLVCDDGSGVTEKYAAKDVIDTFANKTVYKFYENKINRGVTYTKNRTILKASGAWCIMIDCDDYFDIDGGHRMLDQLHSLTQYPVVFFHCLDNLRIDAQNFIGGREISLPEYANNATGEEALTVFNRHYVDKPPYPGCLRGYEGIGVLRLFRKSGGPFFVSSIRSRVYTSDSSIQLSKGSGFRKRMRHIAKGHLYVLYHFGDLLTRKRRLRMRIMTYYYLIR